MRGGVHKRDDDRCRGSRRRGRTWALTHLRLGELDAAAEPIERALSLAPDNSDLVLLAARMEIARGRLDEGVARLRRAVELDARGSAGTLCARRGSRALRQRRRPTRRRRRCSTSCATRAPTNMPIQVERARLAAEAATTRSGCASRSLRSSRTPRTWSAAGEGAVRGRAEGRGGRRLRRAPRATTILRNVLAPVPAFSESLTAVRTPAELIAEPFDRFLVLASPPATPSPPDTSLGFTTEPIGPAHRRITVVLGVSADD